MTGHGVKLLAADEFDRVLQRSGSGFISDIAARSRYVSSTPTAAIRQCAWGVRKVP